MTSNSGPRDFMCSHAPLPFLVKLLEREGRLTPSSRGKYWDGLLKTHEEDVLSHPHIHSSLTLYNPDKQ